MTSRHFHRTGGDPSSTRATRPCTSSIGTAARRGLTLARLPKPHAPLGGRPVPDAPSQTPRPSRDALEPWHHHARRDDSQPQRSRDAAEQRTQGGERATHFHGDEQPQQRQRPHRAPRFGERLGRRFQRRGNPEPLAIRRPEPPGKSIRSTELRQRRAPHRSSRRCTARPSRPSQAPPSTRCLASLPPLRRGNVHRGNRGGARRGLARRRDFPYQAVLDRKADARRWEVSLARWGAARDDPVYPPIARFATRPASDGVDAYVVARREDEDVDDANER